LQYGLLQAQEAATQAAQESEVAEAIGVSMGEASDELSRMYDRWAEEDRGYYTERQRLMEIGDQESLLALETRHANELAERKRATAEFLLELNNRILQEKLLVAELTGAEAAALVQRHSEQAQASAQHDNLEGEAARTADGPIQPGVPRGNGANVHYIPRSDG
jgi:hypothetical protein